MKRFRRTRAALCLAPLWLALSAAAQAAADAVTTAAHAMQTSFNGQSIAPSDSITLTLDAAARLAPGRFAVMVGAEDVTVNFQATDSLTLQGVFSSAALPVGRNLLKVFSVANDTTWTLLAQTALQVDNTVTAQAPGSFKPGAVLGLKSQVWESHSPGASAPSRPRYADATLQASLQTENTGAGWGLKSSIQGTGSSYRPEALQYATCGMSAASVDLASYLVEAEYKPAAGPAAQLALGHVQAGDHALLASGVATRGVVLRHALGAATDLMLSSQSSVPRLGTRDITGLADADNRFSFATLGQELLARAGGLRAEVSAFSGRMRVPASPGSSQPPPASSSHGWGLRLRASSEDNRWRAEWFFASSDNTPLPDPGNVGTAPRQRRHAQTLDLARLLLQDQVVWPSRPDLPLSLELAWRSEHAQPAYLSLGAATNADAASHGATLGATLGPATAELKLGTHEDNLAPDPTRTRNRALVFGARLGLPLGVLIDPQAPNPWWPALDYSLGRNHDFAARAFVPVGSTVADLADTLATSHNIGLNWTLKTVTLGATYSRSLQDNRQASLAQDDTRNTSHGMAATWVASEALALTAGLVRHVTTPLSTGVQTRNLSANASLRWALPHGHALAANLSGSAVSDTPYSASLRTRVGELSLGRSFELPAGGLKLPVQWLVRYTFSHTRAANPGLPTAAPVNYQALQASTSLVF